jgi:hypothetical protein
VRESADPFVVSRHEVHIAQMVCYNEREREPDVDSDENDLTGVNRTAVACCCSKIVSAR